jgi:predicted neuraminidase
MSLTTRNQLDATTWNSDGCKLTVFRMQCEKEKLIVHNTDNSCRRRSEGRRKAYTSIKNRRDDLARRLSSATFGLTLPSRERVVANTGAQRPVPEASTSDNPTGSLRSAKLTTRWRLRGPLRGTDPISCYQMSGNHTS